MELDILHLATSNVAGIALRLVQAERAAGLRSRLVTLTPSLQRFGDDICLNAPWTQAGWHRLTYPLRGIEPMAHRRADRGVIPFQRPDPWPFSWLSAARDRLWLKRLDAAVSPAERESVKLMVLHGGRGITRSGIEVRRAVERGIPLVLFYYGQDLRMIGADRWIDSHAALGFTFEFDHTLYHPDLHFLFYPYELESLPPRRATGGSLPRVAHAPTKRAYKGSQAIVPVLEKLAAEGLLEMVLIEGRPHAEALEIKASCDLVIDQLTDLGYGLNAVEALGMGIPVMTQLEPDFAALLGDHPILHVTAETLESRLREWLTGWTGDRSPDAHCLAWVRERHAISAVTARIADVVREKRPSDLSGWPNPALCG